MEVSPELYERQLKLEQDLISGGIERYREALDKARLKGNFGETMSGSWLIRECLPELERHLDARIGSALAGKAGRSASCVRYLQKLPAATTAYITLKVLVNTAFMGKKTEKTAVARQIGTAIAEELEHNVMRVENLKAYKYWAERAAKASHAVTKKRCLDKLKSLYDRNLFTKINHEDKVQLGLVCIEDAKAVRRLVDDALIRNGRKTTSHIVLNDYFVEQVEQFDRSVEALWPFYEPMLVPPKPWTGSFHGGFVGALGERTKLVRTSNRKYLEDLQLNRDKLGQVFKALNAVQETPWRINSRVLDTMILAAPGGLGYGLPAPDDQALPPPPVGYDTDAEIRQRYAFAIQETRDFNNTNTSNRRALNKMLATARKFKDEAAIYFPHNLDWRGRMYPMASHLSPQGSELSRSLLEFAEGKPLGTREAAGWLAIHGSGCFGEDKVSFEERIAWVKAHQEHILASAENPLDYRWWAEKADKPWMFLAFCFEWAGYLKDGLDHVSRLPVSMDGSCNGLQNFAAMLRHPETARAVNLAPSDRPNDIYQQVAGVVDVRVHELAQTRPESAAELLEEVTRRTRAEIDAGTEGDKTRMETGDLWNILGAKYSDGQISRALVKRPVMTYPYAVTEQGVKEQLSLVLRELYRAGKLDYPYEHTSKIAFMLKQIVYQAVREEVWAAAQAMDWLKSMAQAVSKQNLPISWVAPSGLLVVQEYRKVKTKQINTVVGGIRLRQKIAFEDQAIDPRSQASGIAPNFVHSCDASHLALTVNACVDSGIRSFHMIHDSYGTHASDATTLARLLREQFVAIYSGNILKTFRDNLVANLGEGAADELPEPPPQGDFDLSEVLQSRYFFI